MQQQCKQLQLIPTIIQQQALSNSLQIQAFKSNSVTVIPHLYLSNREWNSICWKKLTAALWNATNILYHLLYQTRMQLAVLAYLNFHWLLSSRSNDHNHKLFNQILYYFVPLCTVSRDSAVGIATGYRLDDWEVGVRVPVGSRIFTSPCRPDWPWGPPNLLYNGYRELFPGAWSWPLTSN
jgi:hypothetical protein